MSQRSDRFKALKDEYEKMVERELPGWLEQLSSYRKMKEEKQAEEEKRKNEVSNISILFFVCTFLFGKFNRSSIMPISRRYWHVPPGIFSNK